MNADPVRERYAEVSYPGGAFAQTHPARNAAIARFFGVPAPDVRTARVLEIGCAQGHNLLPLAARMPEARFTGIDFSEHEIARGRALAAAAGLTNITFIHADLRTFAPPPEAFDHIVAHGVLSWIPDDAKNALFALCARALAPAGVAYVSYNTYPGWKQREALRELMLMRTGAETDPAARLDTARKTLGTLDRMLADRPESHATLTRELIAGMTRKQPGHFYHDDLDGVNDPCYFLQFAAWAAEHGLAYLAEAEWETMFPEFLPAPARAALADFAGDRLMLEQHLDFLRNRSFRCSLLVRAGEPVKNDPDPAALRGLRFGTALRPAAPAASLASGVPVRFGADEPRAFETADPVMKALFLAMDAARPRRVSFAALLNDARTRLAQAGTPVSGDFENAASVRLLDACVRKRVDFLADISPECITTPATAPVARPLTRLMAAQGLPIVTAWHESVALDASGRALLASLDGTRTRFSDEERRDIATFAAAGLLG